MAAKKAKPAKTAKKRAKQPAKAKPAKGGSRELLFLAGAKDLDTAEKRAGLANALADYVLECVDEIRRSEGLPPLKD